MDNFYHKNIIEHAPLLLIPFCMGCGIVFSRYCCGSISPVWLLLAAFIVCGISLFIDIKNLNIYTNLLESNPWVKDNKRLRIRNVLMVSSIFLIGCALGKAALQDVAADWSTREAVFIVEVDNVNKTYGDAVQVDATVLKGDNSGKRIRLYLQGASDRKVYPGNTIGMLSQVKAPHNAGNPCEFDYKSYLITHGVSGTAYCRKGRWKLLACEGRGLLRTSLLAFRERLIEKFSLHFDGESMAVLSAMTLGNKTLVDKGTQQLFSETGTSHILALSGLHVGILYTLLTLVSVRWCRRKRQIVWLSLALVIFIWIFALMCGMTPSLVRASLMMTVVQLAACFRRDNHCINNLSLAAIILLTCSPLLLFDVGFQLSFAAVFGISLYIEYLKMKWFPTLTRSQKRSPYTDYGISNLYYKWRAKLAARYYKNYVVWRRAFLQLVCVSLSAQIGTLPFVIYYFHIVSPYALLANFVVIPLAYLILAFAVLFFLVPFAQPVFAYCLQKCLDVLFSFLEKFSTLPLSSIEWHANTFTLICVLTCVVCTARYHMFPYRRTSRKISLVCVVLAFAIEAYDWRPNRVEPCIWVYNEPQTTAIHFVSSANSSYILSSQPEDSLMLRLSYVSENYWKKKHMQSPTYIGSEFINKEIMRKGELVQFGSRRVLWLNHDVMLQTAARRTKLDVLVLSRGCTLTADRLMSDFAPRQVVLDPSLPKYTRSRLKNDFRALRVKVHDVAEQGAFCLKLDNELS